MGVDQLAPLFFCSGWLVLFGVFIWLAFRALYGTPNPPPPKNCPHCGKPLR
jgi:hypothetical protein